jgi:hypothetical protein
MKHPREAIGGAMIVTPDFREHWKTQLLVRITHDESAPLAVISGWAYCQIKRRWEFPTMSAKQLAGICRWGKMQPACHLALLEAGFVERFEKGFSFHDWDDANARLIHNWKVGPKGGRPKKPKGKPGVTQGFRNETQSEPIRSDQTGLEEKHTHDVNIVNAASAQSSLTILTKSKVPKDSMQWIARQIGRNTTNWCWDSCKVKSSEISISSLTTVLKDYADLFDEKTIYARWDEAVKRAHQAKVDQLANKNLSGYAIACFKEQLSMP